MRSSLLKTILIAGFFFLQAGAYAQDAKELYNTAMNFMREGDYANAILVLNQSLQLEPGSVELRKQLGFAYYLKGDMTRSRDIIEPLLNKKDADAQLYQIAGNIYQARQEWKTAQKLYEKGIRKFPESGELYNDNGQLLMFLKLYDGGMNSYLKGIEKDPSFPGNYYNAARAYSFTNDPVWTILYGEIFVNLESYTNRTAEVRGLLIEAYKKLYNDPSLLSDALPELDDSKKSKRKAGDDFAAAFKQAMAKQISVVSSGIDPEALVMLRTRFLLDWYNFSGMKFPYALFDFQRKLLKDGMFEAYNQWIFGPVSNQAAYRSWTSLHKKEYDEFLQYQRSHPLKPRLDEYYNDGRFTLARP